MRSARRLPGGPGVAIHSPDVCSTAQPGDATNWRVASSCSAPVRIRISTFR